MDTTFDIELPTEPIEAELTEPATMILFGPPKIGKTTAVLELPGCFDISLEKRGTSFVKGLKIQIPDDLSALQNVKWLRAVAKKIKSAGRPYDFVAIDTLTKVDEWCEWAGTERYMNSTQGKEWNRWNRVDHPTKKELWGQRIPFGHEDYESIHTQGKGYGYKWSRLEILDIYHELEDLGRRCTIFICHTVDTQVKKINSEEEINAKGISLTGLVKEIIARQVDAIGYVYRGGDENDQLMVSFRGNEAKVGGMRGNHLKGYQGPLDWSKIFI